MQNHAKIRLKITCSEITLQIRTRLKLDKNQATIRHNQDMQQQQQQQSIKIVYPPGYKNETTISTME